MEFLERNYAVLKEAKGDYDVRGDDKFSTWLKDARGVHRTMNMFSAYFMAPALITYLTGYNQTLVEHTGKEFKSVKKSIPLKLKKDVWKN